MKASCVGDAESLQFAILGFPRPIPLVIIACFDVCVYVRVRVSLHISTI